jgi:hypothetical protein
MLALASFSPAQFQKKNWVSAHGAVLASAVASAAASASAVTPSHYTSFVFNSQLFFSACLAALFACLLLLHFRLHSFKKRNWVSAHGAVLASASASAVAPSHYTPFVFKSLIICFIIALSIYAGKKTAAASTTTNKE